MNIELNNAVLTIDRLISIGITPSDHIETVKTGERYFLDIFEKVRTVTTRTYNIEFKYYLEGKYREFVHTKYDSYSSAENALDSIKKQIKEYDKNYVDKVFEDTVIKEKA